MENIFTISFFIILIISSYTDIKQRIISNKLMLISFAIGVTLNILYGKPQYIIYSLVLYIVFLFSPIKGGGDVKLLAIAILFLHKNIAVLYFFLSIIALFIILYHKILKRKIESIPLAPFILIAFIINTLLHSLKF